MRERYFIFFFIAIMVIALGGYAAIQLGIMPVALVNQKLIAAKDFNESVASVQHYYRETAKQAGKVEVESKASTIEVKRAMLDKLIENALIQAELEDRMTKKDLAAIVSKKIGALPEVKAPQFSNAVMTLYGISADRFQKLVLEPKAREEVLTEKLVSEKTTLETRLTELRKKASVRIIISGLHWENAGVIVQGR